MIFRFRIWKFGSGDRHDLVFRLCVGKVRDGGDEEEVCHGRYGDQVSQQQQQHEVCATPGKASSVALVLPDLEHVLTYKCCTGCPICSSIWVWLTLNLVVTNVFSVLLWQMGIWKKWLWLGNMVEHPKSKSTQPGARGPQWHRTESTYSYRSLFLKHFQTLSALQ